MPPKLRLTNLIVAIVALGNAIVGVCSGMGNINDVRDINRMCDFGGSLKGNDGGFAGLSGFVGDLDGGSLLAGVREVLGSLCGVNGDPFRLNGGHPGGLHGGVGQL